MHDITRFRFSLVLVALLAYWGVVPLLNNFFGLRIMTDLFFSATLVFVVFAVSQERRHGMVAVALGLPMLVCLWLVHLAPRPMFELVASIFEVFFFGYTAWLLLARILRASEVSREVIAAAVVVYMFLGLIWAGLYSIIELTGPGAFTMASDGAGPTSQRFVYFSFTTLTTLGYGDISPLSAPARAFATLEAMIGQIYLTVLIARLVGIHVAQSLK